jgi:hypothetical protein
MERRNVLTLEPQDPEFVAAAFSHDSRLRRAIEGRRLDIVIDGLPLRYWWRDWELNVSLALLRQPRGAHLPRAAS